MSLQKVLRIPEFPTGQLVQVRLKHWNEFRTGIIYPNGKMEHVVWDAAIRDYRQAFKNTYRFHNYIISAHTKGLQVKLLNGTLWDCWLKEFVPKDQRKVVLVVEHWPSKIIGLVN